jgi:DNA polymerase I
MKDPTEVDVELPEFLDISWGWQDSEAKLKLLTESDGVVYRDLPFRPYCYMRRSEVTEETLKSIREIDETAEIVETSDYYQGDLYRVHVSYPTLIRELRETVDIETLQSDVPYSRRVLIDLDESVSEPSRVLSFDLEVKADEGFPDVEEAEQPILTIAAVGSDGQEYTFGSDNERETINRFLDVAKEYRAIMGWNSIRFDFPYLENRCRRLDAEGSEVELNFDPFSFVHVDAFPTYRRILMKGGQSYALEDVGVYEFGDEFGGYPEVDYSALEELFHEDRERLMEYNLSDARVVKRLNDRYQFKKITFGILAKRGHCRPSDIFFVHGFEGGFHGYREVDKASNTLIEGIVMSLSNGDHGPEVVWPNQIRDHEVEFEGAKVLDPKDGLHYNAITLDYASMYPSIIDALNIGPETYRDGNKGEIKGPTGSFVKEPKSRFSEAYHVMKDERDTYTNLKKSLPRSHDEYTIVESLDAGLKTYVNCFVPETTVVTPDGIKKIGNIEVGDDVYSINPETYETEVKPVVDTYERKYEGPMYHINNANYEQKVTPNHRFLVDEYDGELSAPSSDFNEIKDMDERYVIPRNKPLTGDTPPEVDLAELADTGEVLLEYTVDYRTVNAEFDIDGERMAWHETDDHTVRLIRISLDEYSSNRVEINRLIESEYVERTFYRYAEKHTKQPLKIDSIEFLKVVGWYVAEGGEKNIDGSAVIYQQDRNDTLKEDLDNAGLEYKAYDKGVQVPGGIGAVLSKYFGDKSENKRLPEFLYDWDGGDLYWLFHRLCLGDGRMTERGNPASYVTKSTELRKDVTRLAVHVGTIPKDTARDVRFLNEHKSRCDTIDMERDVEIEQYDGKVQCVTAEDNHTILAGLNGRWGWTGQTFYGVIGSGYSRFYSKPVAEAITLMGQKLVDKLAELAEERDLKVIYGDTDSVIIGLGENPEEDPVKHGKRLADEFTAEIKNWVEDEFNGFPDRIDVGLDEVYETFYITDVKKRYAGICVWDGASCYEYDRTGFKSVRGDTSEAVANFVDDLLRAILLENDVWDVVQNYRERLFNGELDDSLVNAVSLRKPVEEYDSCPPHVRVAQNCDDNIRVGDQVPYLKYGSDPKDVVYAPEGPPEEYLTNATYRWMWKKHFKSCMDNMNVSKHEKTVLSDYA